MTKNRLRGLRPMGGKMNDTKTTILLRPIKKRKMWGTEPTRAACGGGIGKKGVTSKHGGGSTCGRPK